MKPSRWLSAVAWVTCAMLVLEHLARLSIHYRHSPAQFRAPKNLIYWILLFLPCVWATLAVVLTRTRRNAIRVIVLLIVLLVYYQRGWVSTALAPVSELPYIEYIDEDTPQPRKHESQMHYQADVTLGIPFYAVVLSGFWFMTVAFCVLADPLRTIAIQWGAWLARDFREPPPQQHR